MTNHETDRRTVWAAALWEAAEQNTIAEWICCDPINPSHGLCVAGGKTLEMLRALIVDDPEAYKPAPLTTVALELAAVPVPPPAPRADALREAADRYEEILANADTGQDPRYWTAVRDITLGLRAMADEERDEQQAQANLDQLADDLANAIASCPGYEMNPNPCRCPCEGCKHHCGAHDASGVVVEAGDNQADTIAAVVARVLYVAEVIDANGIGWAADSIRRACRGDAEQPRTCAHCGQTHDSSSLTHFGAPGGPWYCVDRDDCRGAGGLPPRKRTDAGPRR